MVEPVGVPEDLAQNILRGKRRGLEGSLVCLDQCSIRSQDADEDEQAVENAAKVLLAGDERPVAVLVPPQRLFMILPLGNLGGHSDDRGRPASRRAVENGVPAAEPAPASVLVP